MGDQKIRTDLARCVALTEQSPYMLSPMVPSMMQHPRHYAHAPIAEAIIDIRCESTSPVDLDQLARSADRAELSRIEDAIEVQGTFGLTDGAAQSEAKASQVGYVFRRADGKRIVQARRDRFIFSWLAPYEHWDAFVSEAERHWLMYRDAVQPAAVTRLGVRFVNRIDVPSAMVEIKDYLRIAVEVPAYLPQGIASYFLNTVIPLRPYFEANATITSTLLAPERPNTTSLILDIDTWQEDKIDLSSHAETASINDRLSRLRLAKNYVFESCITDATRGLMN